MRLTDHKAARGANHAPLCGWPESSNGGVNHYEQEIDMNLDMNLKTSEDAATLLLKEHGRDPLIRLAVLLDLAIRRLAVRILTRMRGRRPAKYVIANSH